MLIFFQDEVDLEMANSTEIWGLSFLAKYWNMMCKLGQYDVY